MKFGHSIDPVAALAFGGSKFAVYGIEIFTIQPDYSKEPAASTFALAASSASSSSSSSSSTEIIQEPEVMVDVPIFIWQRPDIENYVSFSIDYVVAPGQNESQIRGGLMQELSKSVKIWNPNCFTDFSVKTLFFDTENRTIENTFDGIRKFVKSLEESGHGSIVRCDFCSANNVFVIKM
jgi:hypothetical protein